MIRKGRNPTAGIDIQNADLYVLTESADLSSQTLRRLPHTLIDAGYDPEIEAIRRRLDIDGDFAIVAIDDDDAAATTVTETAERMPVFGKWLRLGKLPIDIKADLEDAGTPVEFSSDGRFQHPDAERRLQAPTNARNTSRQRGKTASLSVAFHLEVDLPDGFPGPSSHSLPWSNKSR